MAEAVACLFGSIPKSHSPLRCLPSPIIIDSSYPLKEAHLLGAASFGSTYGPLESRLHIGKWFTL